MTVACMRVRSVSAARRGFTLVELLAVVAIIAILAGIIIGISGYAGKKSDRARAIADMERLKTAMEEYRMEKGRYFNASGDVTVITDGGQAFSNALGLYVTGLRMTDPWGRPYRYANSSPYVFRIWSKGPQDDPVTSDDIESTKGEY